MHGPSLVLYVIFVEAPGNKCWSPDNTMLEIRHWLSKTQQMMWDIASDGINLFEREQEGMLESESIIYPQKKHMLC